MLEKEPGVVAALPFGDTSQVEVWTSETGAVTEQAARELIEADEDFTVVGFERRE